MISKDEIDNHEDISQRFLQHAVDEFEFGDRLQASEKAWGAVAHYLKSVAKRRGWRNTSHSDLTNVLYDLARETEDVEKVEFLYMYVGELHKNFYEDSLSYRDISDGIRYADELISKLKNRALPQFPVRPSQLWRRS